MLMYDGVGALQYLINTLCIYVVILNIEFVTRVVAYVQSWEKVQRSSRNKTFD